MSVQTILRLDQALRAAGVPIDGVSGAQGSVRVDYQAAATTAQKTQGAAIVSAFDWMAVTDATWQAQQEKAAATAQIDNGALKAGASIERLVRALALVVLDEVNTLRAASVPALPPRTAAQLVAAIKAKIAASAE